MIKYNQPCRIIRWRLLNIANHARSHEFCRTKRKGGVTFVLVSFALREAIPPASTGYPHLLRCWSPTTLSVVGRMRRLLAEEARKSLWIYGQTMVLLQPVQERMWCLFTFDLVTTQPDYTPLLWRSVYRKPFDVWSLKHPLQEIAD